MKTIVMWLWGAGLATSWLLPFVIGIAGSPIILIPVFGSIATGCAFAQYSANHWVWGGEE